MEDCLPRRFGLKELKRVEIVTAYRYLTTPILLERKQISMLNPHPGQSQAPSSASNTASTSDNTTTPSIVGEKGPLGERGSSLMPRASHNGQSLRQQQEEPEKSPSTKQPTKLPAVREQRLTSEQPERTASQSSKRIQKETTTQRTTEPKQITNTIHQQHVQEIQELKTKTNHEQTGVRTTPVTQHEILSPKKDLSSCPDATASGQSAALFTKLEVADVIEFFEEQAPPRKNSAVQIAEQSVRHDLTNVMEFFEEQPVRQDSVCVDQQTTRQDTVDAIEFFEEHSMEETSQPVFLVVPSPQQGSFHRGNRYPSPSSSHAGVGLNHLDNLIRLMEQLSSLKDENSKLKKKCDYLEATKDLLKVRSDLMTTSDSSSVSGCNYVSTSSSDGQSPLRYHSCREGHRNSGDGRPRLSSAEESQYFDVSESASDGRAKRSKGGMPKRSFSTGSLAAEMMDESSKADTRAAIISKSKDGKTPFGGKSPKQKTKSSKWARLRKALTGQSWYEDLGATLKSLRELGRSSQRYSSIHPGRPDISPPTQRLRFLDTSFDGDVFDYRVPGSPSTTSRSSHLTSPRSSGRGRERDSNTWVGPPDWWEQPEVRMDDVSSVTDLNAICPQGKNSQRQDMDNGLLTVKPLIRRQSSPNLITKGMQDEDGEESEGPHPVHRSSSYKGEELALSKHIGMSSPSSKSERESKKLHRKAWVRMKEIIHVRKDSVKKRPRKGGERDKEVCDWSQGEELSEVDTEGLLYDQLPLDFGSGIISRSTPRSSPMVMPRQQGSKHLPESGLQTLDPSQTTGKMSTSAGSNEMAAILAGSVSQEFAQKMLAWNEIQLRKSPSFKAASGGEAEGETGPSASSDGAALDSPEPQSPLISSEAERHSACRGTTQNQPGQEDLYEGTVHSQDLPHAELLAPSVIVEELHRSISNSFSRKLAEWERQKYRRPTTPEMEPKAGRNRKEKDERTRGKMSREEKERERQEKAREREMQKVEKKQVKLEKEKVRIEKERQRTMERQAKLERMKGRLCQTDTDPTSSVPSTPASGSPPLGGSGTQVPTTAPAQTASNSKKKLREWEQTRSSLLASDPEPVPEGTVVSGQPSSSPPSFPRGAGRPRLQGLHPVSADCPDDTGYDDKVSQSDVSYNDDSTSVTDENLTKSNIASLERANTQLVKEVQRKEKEYVTLQEEVNKLTSKLAKVRQEHAAEMARFNRDLETGTVSGPVQLEVGELESTVKELEEKIVQMENAGDLLAESMESAAIGKWQSIEGEEVVSQQLVDMVEQMKSMLTQASEKTSQPPIPFFLAGLPHLKLPPSLTEEQKGAAPHKFETVYSHAMKLQVQMNNLRVSQLERNKEILLIKRQLLLQEVNNVLLQAHITRRETELYQYREAKKLNPSVRRWNTFSAQGGNDARPPMLRNTSLQEKDCSPRILPAPASVSAGSASKAATKKTGTPNTKDGDTKMLKAAVNSKQSGGDKPTDAAAAAACPVITTTCPTPEKSASSPRPASSSVSPTPLADTDNGDNSITVAAATVTKTCAAPPPISKTSTEPTTDVTMATSGTSKVETGSPTLPSQTFSTPNAAASPPAERRQVTLADTETPVEPIPGKTDADGELEQKVSRVMSASHNDHDSLAVSAMESAQSSEEAASGPARGTTSCGSTPTSSPSAAAGRVDFAGPPPQSPKAMRSPGCRHKCVGRQKEEKDKKEGQTSPKAPHTGDSGKPPLPRQTTPQQSPTIQLRSKAVADVNAVKPNGMQRATSPRDPSEKLEKRSTMCETEDRKIELRKTPSPTLHIPRVGLVSRVRRLKPATELLQESQRYRSGHSIYATRIMNRYLPAKTQQHTINSSKSQDKENISGKSFTHDMSIRSQGSSSNSSCLSLEKTESVSLADSGMMAHVVQKLNSSPNSPNELVDPETGRKTSSPPCSSSTPLKDLTNDSQMQKVSFALQGGERHAEDQPSLEVNYTDSVICPSGHASTSAEDCSHSEQGADGSRQRAATYCVSEAKRHRQQDKEGHSAHNGSESIEHISEEFLDPALREGRGQKISPSSSTNSKNVLCCQSSICTSSNSSPSTFSPETSKTSKHPSSPKTKEHRSSKGKMETIGVLCKQSMSFDLGVSLGARSPEPEMVLPRPLSAESLEPASEADAAARQKAHPSSTSSEGETTHTTGDDKKKTRSRFLDTRWLQKPKKFFKVSK